MTDALPGIKLDKGIDADYSTAIANVFAGGDIVRRASTVVAAVADRMRTAQKIGTLMKGV